MIYYINPQTAVFYWLFCEYHLKATVDGDAAPAPSLKGNTGIMELGWKVNANKNLDLDLGATGYTGKQKGTSLNLALNFKF